MVSMEPCNWPGSCRSTCSVCAAHVHVQSMWQYTVSWLLLVLLVLLPLLAAAAAAAVTATATAMPRAGTWKNSALGLGTPVRLTTRSCTRLTNGSLTHGSTWHHACLGLGLGLGARARG